MIKKILCYTALLLLGGVVGIPTAYTSIITNIPHESLESRHKVLELFAEGKLSENASFTITQKGNNKNFSIKSIVEEEQLSVLLIPEIEGSYIFPSIASWKFVFNEDRKLINVTYYLQDGFSSRIEGTSYLSSMEFSLILHDKELYNGISIPMSMKSFIKMPLSRFIKETKQALLLDWVFSDAKFFDIHNKAQNLYAYLQSNIGNVYEDKIDLTDSFLQEVTPDIGIDGLDSQALYTHLERSIAHTNTIIKNILQYIGSIPIDTSIFTPYDNNNNEITYTDKEYIPKYTNKAIKFLSLYPDFYVSNVQVNIPFHLDINNKLIDLYPMLYAYSAKYPGNFYIIPIIQRRNIEERTEQVYVGVEILIPYFTSDGRFYIFGFDNIQPYLDKELIDTTDSLEYYFDIKKLRIPSKQEYTKNEPR